jgi:hypothetical protein
MSDFGPPRKIVTFAAWISISLLAYLGAMVADYLLGKATDQLSIRSLMLYKEAKKAEHQREVSEDALYVSKAKAEGYKPMLFPTLYDRPGWRDLANSFKMAPLAPQPNTDLYFCNEGYGLIKYHSDRFGFRNDDAVWNEPEVKGIIVGDSYGQGACVHFEQSISGLLGKEGAKFINLSSIGNSPIHYASVLKIFGKKIKTKNLILLFYANDNMENEESTVFKKIYFDDKIDYFEPSSGWKLSDNLMQLYEASNRKIDLEIAQHLHDDPLMEIDKKINDIKHKDNAIDPKLGNLRTGLAALYRVAVPEELPYGSRLAVDVALETCRSNSCKLIFCYIPNSNYWRPDARASAYALRLKQYVNSKGQNFIDLSAELAPLGDAAYAKAGPHLSPMGYEAVANRLETEMK